MNFLLRVGAYILHPLLMPLIGVIIYYYSTPRFVELPFIQAKVLAVLILTVLIPLILFFLLKNLGVIDSIHLSKVKERIMPLIIQIVLLVLIVKIVFNVFDSPEMYYFFIGILFSTSTALVLAFFKIKASLHQMGIAGVTMFLIALSIHFEINLLLWIALFLIGNGWVATSRLHTTSHTMPELIVGFFIGVIPQLLMVNFWL
ncbi:hypothetical protein ACFQO1_09445 [Jejudonia soesokkakensis]|uniref:Transmembrane protein n=1 Tax=Jejudonia soesokkakensis TaxID=1323432 RepID=A0ABW2MVZ3_9FLAO